MSNGFLQDHRGDKSSKRVAGIALIIQGSIMKMVLFSYGLFKALPTDFEKLDGCAMGSIYIGAALLGWGVLEGKKFIINNKRK